MLDGGSVDLAHANFLLPVFSLEYNQAEYAYQGNENGQQTEPGYDFLLVGFFLIQLSVDLVIELHFGGITGEAVADGLADVFQGGIHVAPGFYADIGKRQDLVAVGTVGTEYVRHGIHL